MKKVRLVTAIFACTSNLILCFAPQAHAEFLADSKLSLNTQNFYFQNDFRDGAGQNQRAEWAQGFTANFTSGFTEGNIGFGLDAVAMLGLKLDSCPGRTGSGLLPAHDADDPSKPNTKDPADEYSKLNVMAKARIYDDTIVKLGALDETSPLVQPNTSRLFLQTFQGGWVNHKFSDEIQLSAGQYQRVRERDSGGEFAKGNITEQTQAVLEKIDKLLVEADSDRTRILSTTIYLKTMEDFAGMNAVWESWIAPEHTPARATVQALMASPDLRVEMSVVAACG